MAAHVVIDGSNIATEGRARPSLRQLKDAVAALSEERPNASMIIVAAIPTDAVTNGAAENHTTKHVFVTGGVASSLGKGASARSGVTCARARSASPSSACLNSRPSDA